MLENLKWKLIERPLLPINNSFVDAFPFLVFFVLLFFASFALRSKRGIKIRPLVQLIAFIFFIFIVHRCFCATRGWIFGFQEIGRNDLSIFNNFFILVPLIAFTLLFGRVFCGWLCPLGTLEETFFKPPLIKKIMVNLSQKTRQIKLLFLLLAFFFSLFFLIKFRPKTFFFVENIAAFFGILTLVMAAIFVLKPELDIRLKKMRYYFLTIWLVIICIGIFVTDPWCALYGNEIDYSSLIGLFAVLASALIVSMAWCRYLCPLGTFLSLTTRFSQTRIKRNKSVVSGDTVREICYVQALGEKSLDENSCLFCKRCVEAKVSEVEEL